MTTGWRVTWPYVTSYCTGPESVVALTNCGWWKRTTDEISFGMYLLHSSTQRFVSQHWLRANKVTLVCCLLFSLIRNMDASSNFRSESVYNNVVYSLAGHVIERLGGGRSWESLLRDLILDPLSMTQTSFYDARDHPDRFARPYLHPDGVATPWTQPFTLPWVAFIYIDPYVFACLLRNATQNAVLLRQIVCLSVCPSVFTWRWGIVVTYVGTVRK